MPGEASCRATGESRHDHLPGASEILDWARATFNEEDHLAAARDRETGGLELKDFIHELEQGFHPVNESPDAPVPYRVVYSDLVLRKASRGAAGNAWVTASAPSGRCAVKDPTARLHLPPPKDPQSSTPRTNAETSGSVRCRRCARDTRKYPRRKGDWPVVAVPPVLLANAERLSGSHKIEEPGQCHSHTLDEPVPSLPALPTSSGRFTLPNPMFRP